MLLIKATNFGHAEERLKRGPKFLQLLRFINPKVSLQTQRFTSETFLRSSDLVNVRFGSKMECLKRKKSQFDDPL